MTKNYPLFNFPTKVNYFSNFLFRLQAFKLFGTWFILRRRWKGKKKRKKAVANTANNPELLACRMRNNLSGFTVRDLIQPCNIIIYRGMQFNKFFTMCLNSSLITDFLRKAYKSPRNNTWPSDLSCSKHQQIQYTRSLDQCPMIKHRDMSRSEHIICCVKTCPNNAGNLCLKNLVSLSLQRI